jgi:hypothetical protein
VKKLASELILRGVSEDSLNFVQIVNAFNKPDIKFNGKKKTKVVRDIGIPGIEIENRELFKTALDKAIQVQECRCN